jgi:hypothetical protein
MSYSERRLGAIWHYVVELETAISNGDHAKIRSAEEELRRVIVDHLNRSFGNGVRWANEGPIEIAPPEEKRAS